MKKGSSWPSQDTAPCLLTSPQAHRPEARRRAQGLGHLSATHSYPLTTLALHTPMPPLTLHCTPCNIVSHNPLFRSGTGGKDRGMGGWVMGVVNPHSGCCPLQDPLHWHLLWSLGP